MRPTRRPGARARTLALASLFLVGACQSASTALPSASTPTPTSSSTATASAGPESVGGYTGVSGAAGFVAPVRAPQLLTVLNGYDNPPPTQNCQKVKGYGHDHCEHQAYGLDLVPGEPRDLLVLAPAAGRILWECVTTACPPASVPNGCLGIRPDGYPTLNLTVCHLSELRARGDVVAGKVLGLRRATDGWVHVSLDRRYDEAGRQMAVATWTPVPFHGPFTIAGVDFAAQVGSPANLHACRTIESHTTATGDMTEPSPLPTIATIDLSACGTGSTPTASGSAPAVSAAWAAPASGAKLTTSTLTLSATVTAADPAAPVAQVAFTVAWGSVAPKKACTATRAASGGAWTCKADLWKLGAPLGSLTLSFDVADAAGAVTKAPAGTRTVTYAAVPGAPTGASFELRCQLYVDCPYPFPVAVAWKRAPGAVDGYRLYWSDVADECAATPSFKKPRLIATVKSAARAWQGPVAMGWGRFELVAFNAAGSGKPARSAMFAIGEPLCVP